MCWWRVTIEAVAGETLVKPWSSRHTSAPKVKFFEAGDSGGLYLTMLGVLRTRFKSLGSLFMAGFGWTKHCSRAALHDISCVSNSAECSGS